VLNNILNTDCCNCWSDARNTGDRIFGLGTLSNRLAKSQISLPDQTVIWWGGLRGSVSIALALSVPAVLPQRQEMIATVFGVVLFTLIFQGLTIKPMLEKLGLIKNQLLPEQ
jgi:CPA1 family monovalent cation:H+ antiporter